MKHPEMERTSKTNGFVIRMADKRFVLEILANGHPENPVIYFTQYAWEGKTWKTIQAAIKARNRVREKAGECEVYAFTYDAGKAERVIGKEPVT